MKFYFLKTTHPIKISIVISLIISILCTTFLYFLFNFYKQINIGLFYYLIIYSFIFLVSFLIFSYILKYFIYNKIRLIYKTIRNLKVQKFNKPDINLNTDFIKKVNIEVKEWSMENRKEISILKERENYRREYIGNISHELKNPIFNIQGYLYSLSNGAINEPETAKKYLKRANKNIDRIINILEDLDTISQLEITDLKPNFKPFNIIHLFNEVIDLFEDTAKKKQITIYFRENYSGKICVSGDASRIKQVLINLIENAIKYSFEKAQIKISIFDMDKYYLIEITDDGPGIAEKDLPRIFERFYRTDKARSRDQGGTGLGLAIVKHIIEAHNQTINVRSRLGVGSTFGFTLSKCSV